MAKNEPHLNSAIVTKKPSPLDYFFLNIMMESESCLNRKLSKTRVRFLK